MKLISLLYTIPTLNLIPRLRVAPSFVKTSSFLYRTRRQQQQQLDSFSSTWTDIYENKTKSMSGCFEDHDEMLDHELLNRIDLYLSLDTKSYSQITTLKILLDYFQTKNSSHMVIDMTAGGLFREYDNVF